MSPNLRAEIYDLIKAIVLPKMRYDNGIMNVLSTVWNVYALKSTGEDSRYKVLGDEIEKHYIMNDDWVDDKLFLSILHVLDDEKKFILFIEQIVEYVKSEDFFSPFKDRLSELLSIENLSLNVEKNDQGYVIFRVSEQGNEPQVPEGAMPVYVCDSNVYNAVLFWEKDIQWPDSDECLVLTFDYEWNDFSYKTRYRLYYYKNGEAKEIGEVKIMKRETADTDEQLPKQFKAIGEDYCSLGKTLSYYRNMRAVLGDRAFVVLRQLRDTAFYESIYKQFEDDNIFKTSLIRDTESDKARQEGRYYVFGRNMEDAFAFSYLYHLPYPGDDVEVSFNYKYNGKDYERIIGMIGENGVGKTTLIKEILHSLVMNDNKRFTGLRPLFSSVLMISYSPFDHYQIESNGQPYFINYDYSGLMKGKEQMYTTPEQVDILAKNIEIVYNRKVRFYTRWEAFVGKVIPIDEIRRAITFGPFDEISIDKAKLLEFCENASSGETMFLYSITAIMSMIRSNSLIIMDEPEQHLHPRAVTALMHSVYKLLEIYDSYALISTHSPYVIRELVSPNVLIFKRFDNTLAVKRIGIESFGEDVSVLSDTVFGNMSDEKRYEKFIETVVARNNYDYDASVSELQTGPNALSLNAKLLIRTVINKSQKRNEAPKS